jgi:putative ABC transport system permease protein
VSQTFANQLLPGRNPLGQSIKVDGKLREVVGVAEDGPSNSLRQEPEPYLYLPYAQAPSGDIMFAVETAGEPAALTRQILGQLKRFDPAINIYSTTTLRRHMDEALVMDRLISSTATAISAIALVLTAAGLFGVVQYTVHRRRREIGLRLALGARTADIRRMVLLESLRIAAFGIPIGLGMTAAAAIGVRSMLFGVAPLAPFAYVTSAAAATALALAAACLPAARAVRIDPMQALRSE